MELSVTRLSSKGQVVIPNTLRKKLGITRGVNFLVFTDGSHLLLKPLPKTRIEVFKKLIKESRAWAHKRPLTKRDLTNAIRASRHAHRS